MRPSNLSAKPTFLILIQIIVRNEAASEWLRHVMTPKEAAKLAWIARVNANIATTPRAKSTLLEIADKYDAIASTPHEPPEEADDG